MIRLAIVTAAVLALLAAPTLAADSLTATRWPAPPSRALEAGDIIMGVSQWDGTSWTLLDAVTIQADHGPTVCGPSLAPARPVG